MTFIHSINIPALAFQIDAAGALLGQSWKVEAEGYLDLAKDRKSAAEHELDLIFTDGTLAIRKCLALLKTKQAAFDEEEARYDDYKATKDEAIGPEPDWPRATVKIRPDTVKIMRGLNHKHLLPYELDAVIKSPLDTPPDFQALHDYRTASKAYDEAQSFAPDSHYDDHISPLCYSIFHLCVAVMLAPADNLESMTYKCDLLSGRLAPSNGEYVNSGAVFEALSRDMRELAGV